MHFDHTIDDLCRELIFLGFFFSIAFKSVGMTIAVLVPFDVALMITSGVFMKLRWAFIEQYLPFKSCAQIPIEF